MLMNFTLGKYKAFNENVFFSLEANKKLGNKNVVYKGNVSLLRSAIIYGPNNSGKTNLVEGLNTMKEIFEKNKVDDETIMSIRNFLFENIEESFPIVFEVTYFDNGCDSPLTYGINIYEDNFLEDYLFIGDDLVYSKNLNDGIEFGETLIGDEFNKNLLKRTSKDSLFIKNVLSNQEDDKNEHCVFQSVNRFFNRLHILNGKNSMSDTFDGVNRMKEVLLDPRLSLVYNYIIQNADLGLIRHYYDDDDSFKMPSIDLGDSGENKFYSSFTSVLENQIKFRSEYMRYNNDPISVFTYRYDSSGTKRFSYLIAEILHSIEFNEILVIDEINDKLHYVLTRELIEFINNIGSSINAQFIMTAHDVKLLDPYYFRKDQVYFVSRVEKNVVLYSLNDFVSNNKNGVDVRAQSDFENKYEKGKIGALPDPDFYDAFERFELYGESQKKKTKEV